MRSTRCSALCRARGAGSLSSRLACSRRARGGGTRLLAPLGARAEGCPELSLICFAANAGALRLYARQGFTVVDRRDIVPHPMIHATGLALLMTAPV